MIIRHISATTTRELGESNPPILKSYLSFCMVARCVFEMSDFGMDALTCLWVDFPYWYTLILFFFYLLWIYVGFCLVVIMYAKSLSVQFSRSVMSTLCNPMNCSTPGLTVHHQLPEFIQTHIHRVGDAIQSSHPLSSPSPPAPNPSQHQSLFQWVNSSHEVAKVLEFQL